MEKIFLGCHVSMSAPDFFLGSVKEALRHDANTFMIYTGAPQNSYRVPLEKLKIAEAKQLMIENNLAIHKLIVHAPYIVNMANTASEEIFALSKRLIAIEMQRTAAMGIKTLVLHPGTAGKAGAEEAVARICEGINAVLEQDNSDVKIALETMAGKGSECGTTIEQMKLIMEGIVKKERVGICLDTCHLHDYGYDLNNFSSLLQKINDLLGIEKILCIHINDSKNICGAKKDRHENIGYGFVGFANFLQIINHPLLYDVPKILETPYIKGQPPYGHEISMLRRGILIPLWREELFK